jgi:hypothetical protein
MEAPQAPVINLRRATETDVTGIQRCNLATLPENYLPACEEQEASEASERSEVWARAKVWARA